ncbi:hypothetical protein D3C73_470780 [compost metagenome]
MEKDMTKIEDRLLKDEISCFISEVEKGAKIIKSAIEKYYDSKPVTKEHKAFKGDVREDLRQWVNLVLTPQLIYAAGDYTTLEVLKTPAIPEFLQKIMLQHAVDKFFENIEAISQVLD